MHTAYQSVRIMPAIGESAPPVCPKCSVVDTSPALSLSQRYMATSTWPGATTRARTTRCERKLRT